MLPVANNPLPLAVEVFKTVSGDAAVKVKQRDAGMSDGGQGLWDKSVCPSPDIRTKTVPLIIIPTQSRHRRLGTFTSGRFYSTEPKAYRVWGQVGVKTSHRPDPRGAKGKIQKFKLSPKTVKPPKQRKNTERRAGRGHEKVNETRGEDKLQTGHRK